MQYLIQPYAGTERDVERVRPVSATDETHRFKDIRLAAIPDLFRNPNGYVDISFFGRGIAGRYFTNGTNPVEVGLWIFSNNPPTEGQKKCIDELVNEFKHLEPQEPRVVECEETAFAH